MVNVLFLESQASPLQSNTPQRIEYAVVGVLTDRSFLSDEMVDLCKRVSIYLVKEESLLENAEKQKHRQRKLNPCCLHWNLTGTRITVKATDDVNQ